MFRCQSKFLIAVLAAWVSIASIHVAFAETTSRTAEEADQKDIDDLMKAHQNMADQYKAINQLNPLAQGMDQASGPMDVSKLPPQFQAVGKLLARPKVQEHSRKMVALMMDKDFQKDAGEVGSNPNLKWMFAGMGLVFILYVIVKWRVLAATDRWWVRLILRLSMAVMFYFGIFLVAYVSLGQPFLRVLWAAKKAFI